MSAKKTRGKAATPSRSGLRRPSRAAAPSASAKRKAPSDAPAERARRGPQNHRTVDRVTRILEEVVYKPGLTFAELVRTLGAAKSSVHGFIRGLLANGWLYEEKRRFYLGPAVYGLTLVSGHIRAGVVTHAELLALHEQTGLAVVLGVQAGDHLMYLAEAGTDPVVGFEARSNIRRTILETAGGKALLAARPDGECAEFLRRRSTDEKELVARFIEEYDEIRKTRIATNVRLRGAQFAIATTVRNQSGQAVAAVTILGPTVDVQPRFKKLSELLIKHVDSWSRRSITPREAI